VPLRSPRGNLADQLATLPRDAGRGNAAGNPRGVTDFTGSPPPTDWVAVMIMPTTVTVVLGGTLSCLVDGCIGSC
jgi:hypothetical protein